MKTAPKQGSILPVLVVLAFGAVLPYLLTGGFQLRLAVLIWIYAVLSMGFNLLYGFTGQISLGQQAFFAIGAYAFTLFQVKAQWPAGLALVASLAFWAVLAAAAGVCFSIVSLRVDPSLSEFRVLVSILTIAVVGGLGTRFGPIIGS